MVGHGWGLAGLRLWIRVRVGDWAKLQLGIRARVMVRFGSGLSLGVEVRKMSLLGAS